MQEKYSAAKISKVMSQSLTYQCACPAQVCGAIVDLREVYEYQKNCMTVDTNDQRMHQAIATAAEKAHQILEECLTEILEIEGWDKESMTAPQSLKDKQIKPA